MRYTHSHTIPILLNRFLIIAHSLHLLLIIVEYIINVNIINHLVYNVEYTWMHPTDQTKDTALHFSLKLKRLYV